MGQQARAVAARLLGAPAAERGPAAADRKATADPATADTIADARSVARQLLAAANAPVAARPPTIDPSAFIMADGQVYPTSTAPRDNAASELVAETARPDQAAGKEWTDASGPRSRPHQA